MSVTKFPPPKRYCVEDVYDDELGLVTGMKVVEVTGEEDPVYIDGLESPWIGASLNEIETIAYQGGYGNFGRSIAEQVKNIRGKK